MNLKLLDLIFLNKDTALKQLIFALLNFSATKEIFEMDINFYYLYLDTQPISLKA